MPDSDALLLTCRGDDASEHRAENPGSLRVLRVEERQLRSIQVVAPANGLGFGPRNAVFHPAFPWLYVVLERQNALALFLREGARIAPRPSLWLERSNIPSRSYGPNSLAQWLCTQVAIACM